MTRLALKERFEKVMTCRRHGLNSPPGLRVAAKLYGWSATRKLHIWELPHTTIKLLTQKSLSQASWDVAPVP
jgi:hypothetical protein